jgi:hypothetical protein
MLGQTINPDLSDTINRYKRYGVLGLPTLQAERLALSEGCDVTPIVLAYLEGRWSV